jgi:thiol-disulfide isomerase/thioredoxin
MKKYPLIAFGFAIAILLTLSCSSQQGASAGKPGPGSGTAQKIPGISSGTFAAPDLDGNIVRFEEYKGKGPLILNFWGTWCPPCKREIPDLKRIYTEYKPRGLEIIGLAVNDTPQRVKAFASQYGIDWVMLMVTQEAATSFQIGTGIPVTIFIDRDGREVDRFIGMRTYNDFKAVVERII